MYNLFPVLNKRGKRQLCLCAKVDNEEIREYLRVKKRVFIYMFCDYFYIFKLRFFNEASSKQKNNNNIQIRRQKKSLTNAVFNAERKRCSCIFSTALQDTSYSIRNHHGCLNRCWGLWLKGPLFMYIKSMNKVYQFLRSRNLKNTTNYPYL